MRALHHSDPPARANLAEQVYTTLKTELHDFRWVPGDRFSEGEIGTRLGVSRTPVREALFRLRNEGFLEVESKSGWYVRPIDFARLDQLYDLRIVLELASVDRLVARRDDDPPTHDALEALKAVWLVPAAERLDDARAVDLPGHHAAAHAYTGQPRMARIRLALIAVGHRAVRRTGVVR